MKQLPFNRNGLIEKIQKSEVLLTKDEMYRVRGGDGYGNGEELPPPEDDSK
ncbi:MAG: hypothetical protein KAS71_01255 [Bacteroidales bacterium]|nr:hypothetical protein [Bacteroidales bacterium]